MPYRHVTAMLDEAVHHLNCTAGKICVDCTIGGSGHARKIIEKILPGGLLIGIDQDTDAIENAKKVLEPYKDNIRLFRDNFINLPTILDQLNLSGVDGILLDLGLSLHQLESSGRGFSFRKDEPLDMRMDVASDQTAGDLINRMDTAALKHIFKKYGEERWAGRIAWRIVEKRKAKEIESTKELADLVCEAVPKSTSSRQKIHPATRVFMALRIAVNKELERLESFMDGVIDLLNTGGRLCVLSFHSLEDRIVKHKMKAFEKGCTCPPDFPRCVCNKKPQVAILTRKVVRPTEEEIDRNPMARSTRLRAMEKL
jgi:16S rRNA (cytosine1402-N4)-methyltransferase